MSLTSLSTETAALAQYNDNLSWDGNPTKAALALEAIRFLLVNKALKLAVNGRQIDNSHQYLENEKKEILAYLAKNTASTGAITNRVTFTRGRAIF